MKALLILALLVSWLSPTKASADLVPDNHDYVEHEIFCEGMDRFPNLTFVLYPTQSTEGWAEIRAGKSLDWFRYASPQVRAFPREIGPPTDDEFFRRPEVLESDLVIFRSRWVPKGSGIAHKSTVYRIVGIEGREIRVEPGMEEQFDASGKLLQAVPAPVLHRPKSRASFAASTALEKVPFGVTPGTYFAMAAVSALGLFALFKLRKSTAARDSKKS